LQQGVFGVSSGLIYPPNAFATGARKNAALVAVSTGLLRTMRRDEVEAQWAWIDRIRAAWKEKGVTPRPYAAGTWGPSAAIALTERDGISWHE